MLEIGVNNEQDVIIVEVHGRVDSMTAGQLGDSLSTTIEQGNDKIVLDLGGVEYMSSAGLREIVSALKLLKKASGDLRVAQPMPRVVEIFEMAGLDSILRVFATKQEAVASYQS
jgi:anti-anti-sigma factor